MLATVAEILRMKYSYDEICSASVHICLFFLLLLQNTHNTCDKFNVKNFTHQIFIFIFNFQLLMFYVLFLNEVKNSMLVQYSI